jgi:HEAT repeat protein
MRIPATASVEGTRDPDPAVRTAAVAGLERVRPDERVSVVTPLLGDPVRAVRIEAARVLSSVPPDRLDASKRRADERAVGEFTAA